MRKNIITENTVYSKDGLFDVYVKSLNPLYIQLFLKKTKSHNTLMKQLEKLTNIYNRTKKDRIKKKSMNKIIKLYSELII